MDVIISPARTIALAASAGATDFGEYFTYFSFFLVVSALLLVVLFFKLGVEQRLRQIGILRASGFTMADIRRLTLGEGAALALVGGALGALGAVLYGRLIVYGLGTWWVGPRPAPPPASRGRVATGRPGPRGAARDHDGGPDDADPVVPSARPSLWGRSPRALPGDRPALSPRPLSHRV